MKLFGNRRRAAHTKKSALSRGTRTALIAAVIVLAVAGSAFAAWKLLVKPVERPALSEPEPEPPAEEEAPEPSVIHVTPQELEPEQQPEEDVPTEQPKALRDGVYNILICGTDGDGYRTDTIIVAHLDANTHTVALLSIPRDTPVATGGGGLMKINSVYAGGGADGMERLASRLHSLLGFPVDGYVLVDLEAFKKTVDLVGGVDFDVPQDMDYEDASQDLYIHLKKGPQHLDGEKAMELVRFRKGYATQDIQRTQVQQQFLKALAKQCLSVSSLTKIGEFADIFAEYVTTSLTTGNMVWFGKELLACDFHVHEPLTHGGHWHELYARPDQPWHLELGCGKGGFLAQIATAHPDINYLGIDITDKVLILAKRKVEAAYAERGLPADNVKIASLDIERLGNAFTPEDRVSRIYINFCNPWSKNAGSNKHRLTHPRQLLQYRRLMDEGAEIWFKTDDDDLFRDSLAYFPAAGFEITWQTFDLHKDEPDWNLRTEHEGMFSEQGIPIKALIARKGPDSSVTWVEPKALARQQEAEDESD